jgi:pilus assembly protein Flp/PilA
MKELLMRLWREESGQGMAEYGLILALVAIAVIAALSALSGGLQNIFNNIGSRLTSEAAKATQQSSGQ